ncbi:putative bsd domain-containing protein [Botrytis fragariae]|uniref:Putative bsd domain-containing protein n=1 Tax=Botrytis fragariae TaxID=1964551 RepID=A0A8H6ANC7_9HELO|nr:putative bsd domain-containing protein [Botrytis fragariae]KAF5870529.1 putative bsd domain-containing protein [Botrytis fragariae]
MDLAYDHIQEEALQPDQNKEKSTQPAPTLNADFQEAYKAISSSPWGAKLGGFFGSVVKQGENVYKEAQQEFNTVSEEATKGFTDLRSSIISRTRGLTITQAQEDEKAAAGGSTSKDGESTSKDLTTDEALKESEGVLARLKTEAAKRLVEIQKAEDAADEALLKFGTNIRNFLKDAVSIAPPTSNADGQVNAVLFESKDSQGKRVIHTTRFDAQLHVIHSTLDSFTTDPISEEFEPWAKTFSVDKKTDDIAKDLEKYEELRSSMEKLVPDKVKYEDFFKRYYFLRHSIETAEAKRRDLLKGAAATEQEEDVKWTSDSDDDSEEEDSDDDESEDEDDKTAKVKTTSDRPASAESSITLHPATQDKEKSTAASPTPTLKPTEPRKSNDEKSQADSDGSYDVVGAASGAPSRAPNSPKEKATGAGAKKDESDDDDDSEEEDWE